MLTAKNKLESEKRLISGQVQKLFFILKQWRKRRLVEVLLPRRISWVRKLSWFHIKRLWLQKTSQRHSLLKMPLDKARTGQRNYRYKNTIHITKLVAVLQFHPPNSCTSKPNYQASGFLRTRHIYYHWENQMFLKSTVSIEEDFKGTWPEK